MKITHEVKTYFFSFADKYSKNLELIEKLFEEIKQKYNSPNRHYHNFKHIYKMLKKAKDFKTDVEKYDDLIFAIIYHDVIYNSLKKNNERKSAEFAEKHLKQISYPQEGINHVLEMIIRTENHFYKEENESPETQILLDLDLMLLASDYKQYSQNTICIRKEYKHVPKILFNKGRTIFLKKMLDADSIYRTKYFKNNFEEKAIENLNREILDMK